MALTCPRCGTEVQYEAMYCPYCSLPKPRRGFANAVEGKLEEKLEEATPPEQPKPAFAFKRSKNAAKESQKKATKPTKRSSTRPGRAPRKLRLPVVSVAALVAFFSVAIYVFVVPLVYSEQAEPKTVLSALDMLRRMPSSEPGLTIDARLARELETSRRVGNLVGYQGWSTRPIKGSKTDVLLVYSYDEVGNVHQRAEWLASLTDNTFKPQTDLAVSVSKK
jgi:hypothetical protein